MNSGSGGKCVALLEIMAWMPIHELPTYLSSPVFYGLFPMNEAGSVAPTTFIVVLAYVTFVLWDLGVVRSSGLFSGMSGYTHKVEKSEC